MNTKKKSIFILIFLLLISCDNSYNENEGSKNHQHIDNRNPFQDFVDSSNEILLSDVRGTDSDFSELFKKMSKYYSERDFGSFWEECFSEGFKRSYSKDYFVNNISEDWKFDSFSYQSIHRYENSARINFTAVSETENRLISYADTLYLIKESEWKIENFPFDGSGFFEYTIPPAFYRSIWDF